MNNRLQNIKLIAFDIDGTLTNNHSVISPENCNALQILETKGYEIALCSGRQAADIAYVAKQMQLHKFHILSLNGAYCIHAACNTPFFSCTLNANAVKQCINIFNTQNSVYNCFHGNTLIHNRRPEYEQDPSFWTEERKFRRSLVQQFYGDDYINEFAIKGFHKITYVNLHDKTELLQLKQKMMQLSNVDITSSWDCNFEIMPQNCNKGIALLTLAHILQIEKEDILCFGDNENDIPMFDSCFHSVCVSTGNENAMMKSKYIAKNENYNGVFKFLQQYIL
ncbi:MAG: HAD family hydrolase [Eubacteriales bacterium]|nr:HAD family hydrolase [Eubacteriales bacterium]